MPLTHFDPCYIYYSTCICSVDSRYIGGAVRFATGAPPNVSDSTAPLATVDTPGREDVLRNVRIGQPTDDAPFAFSMRLVDSDGTGSPLSGWYACSTHLIVAVTVNTHMATCVANWDREENSSAPAYYQLQIDANENDEVCAVTRLTAVGYAPELRAVGYTGGSPMNWWVKNCGD